MKTDIENELSGEQIELLNDLPPFPPTTTIWIPVGDPDLGIFEFIEV